MTGNIQSKLDKHLLLARKGGSDKGASRSHLLKVIMPHLSGKRGDSLAQALESNNVGEFEKLWASVTSDVLGAVRSFDSKKGSK